MYGLGGQLVLAVSSCGSLPPCPCGLNLCLGSRRSLLPLPIRPPQTGTLGCVVYKRQKFLPMVRGWRSKGLAGWAFGELSLCFRDGASRRVLLQQKQATSSLKLIGCTGGS